MAIDKTIKIVADTGDAQKKVDELKVGVEGIDAGAAASKKGFGIMRKGVQAVGLSLKAMGIGLVIAAFVQLKEIFMSNQGVMDSVAVGAETLKVVLQKIIDVALKLGEKMSGAFSDPKQAIADLWDALKQNLVNRLNGLIDQFKALGKIIKGVFKMDMDLIKEGAGDAATATIQLYTGLDKIQQSNVAETLKETAKELKKVTKEGNAYAKVLVALRNEVKLAEAEQRQLQLTYQRDAELQRQIRDDVSRTIEDRIKANEELADVLEKQFKEEQALAQKKIDLAQMELDQNSTNIDLKVALMNAKTDMMDLDERITGQQSEQLTNLNALEKERADAIKTATEAQDKRNKLTERALELGLDFQKTISDEEIKLLIDTEEKKLAIQKKSLADQKKAKEDQIAAVKAMEIKAGQSILSTLGQLAGEGTAMAKATALTNILINTAQGISAAIKAGAGLVFPANLGAIATGVATVLSGIASAKGILSKVPGPGGEGPMPSVAEGGGGDISGISGMIPNLEAISPATNGIQPVQAFVVENDISNAQALQEELDIQATL